MLVLTESGIINALTPFDFVKKSKHLSRTLVGRDSKGCVNFVVTNKVHNVSDADRRGRDWRCATALDFYQRNIIITDPKKKAKPFS